MQITNGELLNEELKAVHYYVLSFAGENDRYLELINPLEYHRHVSVNFTWISYKILKVCVDFLRLYIIYKHKYS